MAIDTGAAKSRRAVLAGAIGGAGALAISALGHPAAVAAAANGNVQLGHGTADTDNDSAAETRVNGTTSGITALSGVQAGSGIGLAGTTGTGIGTQGVGTGTGVGLKGTSNAGNGARGESIDNTPSDFLSASNKTGVIGTAGDASGLAANTDEIGVLGYCNVSSHSTGVLGVSTAGVGAFGIGAIGVIGFGSWGVLGDVDTASIGVYGNTGAAAAPAVTGGIGVLARAQATTQVALKVLGKTQFSRSGRTYVSAGASSRKVSMTGVTTSSYVIATLQTNRAGVYVQAVVPGTGYFTIYLNKAVSATTYVGYLVIN
jgi:hypothetical protein